MSDWASGHGEAWPTWVFSNHDAPRVASRFGAQPASLEQTKLWIALLLSLRGSVCLYQGEELGLPQADVPFDRLVDPEAIANWPMTLGRDGARTPMPWEAKRAGAGFSDADPWLPIDPRHLALAVDQQNADPTSVLSTARDLLRTRRAVSVLREGACRVVEGEEGLLWISRSSESRQAACVFNLGTTRQSAVMPAGRWHLLAGNAVLEESILQLPPCSYAWLVTGS
jgi:alpha-glucosidase